MLYTILHYVVRDVYARADPEGDHGPQTLFQRAMAPSAAEEPMGLL